MLSYLSRRSNPCATVKNFDRLRNHNHQPYQFCLVVFYVPVQSFPMPPVIPVIRYLNSVSSRLKPSAGIYLVTPCNVLSQLPAIYCAPSRTSQNYVAPGTLNGIRPPRSSTADHQSPHTSPNSSNRLLLINSV